jgi:hypothetical protein
MNAVKWSPILIALLVFGLSNGLASQFTDRRLLEFKNSAPGQQFLRTHSEQDLSKVIRFLDDPKGGFDCIQKIADVAKYVDSYDYFVMTTGRQKEGFWYFLHKNFQSVDPDKADILTFLLLSFRFEGGINAEALGSTYAHLFAADPSVFLPAMEKDDRWKSVVESLFAEWSIFKKGVAKLGDSEFERQLKAYVVQREYIWKKKRNASPDGTRAADMTMSADRANLSRRGDGPGSAFYNF